MPWPSVLLGLVALLTTQGRALAELETFGLDYPALTSEQEEEPGAGEEESGDPSMDTTVGESINIDSN